jgi:DNA-binding YbaB/EbfC family protein
MNIQEMMKQAKVMQDKMKEMQGKLADLEVTGQSGGGMIQVVMTCKGDIRGLTIAPEIIDPSDKETLEDLIKAAINNARVNADQRMGDETQRMMQDMGLPADMELPNM